MYDALWRKDEGLEGNVWVKLDPRRFGPGQRVEFSVGAETPQREPVDDATLSSGDEVQIGKFRLVFLSGPRAGD